jgi:hypothetical protein
LRCLGHGQPVSQHVEERPQRAIGLLPVGRLQLIGRVIAQVVGDGAPWLLGDVRSRCPRSGSEWTRARRPSGPDSARAQAGRAPR